MGVLEETPRSIRDVNLGVGTIIQMFTTTTLRRGYLCRGVTDYILCEIDSQADRQEATLTFVGVCTTLKEADEWIMGPAT